MKNEFLDLPEGIPSTVEGDVSHASVMYNSGREAPPIRQFKITLDNAESEFQVRVSLIILGSRDRVSTGNGTACCLVCFVADALALDREVRDFGAETSLVPELGNNHRTSS